MSKLMSSMYTRRFGKGVFNAAGIAFIEGSEVDYVGQFESNDFLVTVPQSAQDGDLLLSFVMHRSDVTPPAGWTLIREETVNVFTSTGEHSLSVFSKKCDGDSGNELTFSQEVQERGAAHVLVFRGRGGASIRVETPSSLNGAGAPYEVAEAGSASGRKTGIVGITWNGAVGTLEPPEGYLLTTPTGTGEDRLAVSYKKIGTGVTQGEYSAAVGPVDDSDHYAQVSISLAVYLPGGLVPPSLNDNENEIKAFEIL